jgi:sigma-B regulation protein RsbU (phosphoserine phosphatase)
MSPATRILLIDDDRILQQVLQRVLNREGAEVVLASDGPGGLAAARGHHPQLVLCDWNMEGMDGLEVCRRFKADPDLSNVFFILLTSRSALEDRVAGLDSGADDFLAKPVEPAELTARVRAGMRLYESNRSLRQLSRDLDQQKQLLEEEMARAAEYVISILPTSIDGPIATESLFLPSQKLGGDCYDFYWLDDDHFVFYMLDVSGHGLAAALPSISIYNLLRSSALSKEIRSHPEKVLEALNSFFQMGRQNQQYFTIWYGVYQPSSQTLNFASAGHPPCLLLSPMTRSGRSMKELKTNGLPIGLFDDAMYVGQSTQIEPGSLIYLYTDGIYETLTKAGHQPEAWSFESFSRLMQSGAGSDPPKLEKVIATIQERSGVAHFNDDVSLMQVRFMVVPDS